MSLIEWIKNYWPILITFAGWIVTLVTDHKEIKYLKVKVKKLDDNFDAREITSLKESFKSLENKYDALSDEIRSIRTLLSEISTKVGLLIDGKINISNGDE